MILSHLQSQVSWVCLCSISMWLTTLYVLKLNSIIFFLKKINLVSLLKEFLVLEKSFWKPCQYTLLENLNHLNAHHSKVPSNLFHSLLTRCCIYIARGWILDLVDLGCPLSKAVASREFLVVKIIFLIN